MPSFTQTDATGEGSAAIDGGTTHAILRVTYFNVAVASPRVRVNYTIAPFFLQFAGQVMIGLLGGGNPLVFDSFGVNWQPGRQHAVVGGPVCDGVLWKLPLGVTASINVEW